MANQDVVALIRKAITDDVFRLGLSKDLDKSIQDHNLSISRQEREALANVDWDTLAPGSQASSTWVHIYKSDVAGNLRGNILRNDNPEIDSVLDQLRTVLTRNSGNG